VFHNFFYIATTYEMK